MLNDDVANYNKGFAARKALLGLSSKENCEIPLNRYSFESLEEKLLPHTKIEWMLNLIKTKIWFGDKEMLMAQQIITD